MPSDLTKAYTAVHDYENLFSRSKGTTATGAALMQAYHLPPLTQHSCDDNWHAGRAL